MSILDSFQNKGYGKNRLFYKIYRIFYMAFIKYPYKFKYGKMEFRIFDYLLIKQLRNNSFELKNLKIMEDNINKESVCVDIGSHIGYYTLIMSKLGKKVYSFEPAKENFILLEKNVRINDLKNVEVFNYGLGNIKWDAFHLFKNKEDSGDYRCYNAEGLKQSETILMIKFDDFKLGKIDFVKIDTQGYELEVLKGMEQTLKDNPQIKLITEFTSEYLMYGKDGKDLKEFLMNYFSNIKYLEDNYLYCYNG